MSWRDDAAVEPVGDEVAADGGHEQPRGVDLLAALEGDHGEGPGAGDRHGNPGQESENAALRLGGSCHSTRCTLPTPDLSMVE